MDKFKRKKRGIEYLNSIFVLFLLVVVAFFVGKSSWDMYQKSKETRSVFETVEQEFSSLEEQYDDVSKNLNNINTNTGFEKEVRSKFELSKQGEKAIFIIEEKLPPLPNIKEKTFWEKTKDWLPF